MFLRIIPFLDGMEQKKILAFLRCKLSTSNSLNKMVKPCIARFSSPAPRKIAFKNRQDFSQLQTLSNYIQGDWY